MSTRLMIRGRTAWASPDFWREERARAQFARTTRAENRLAQDLEDNPPPPAHRSPSLPGEPIADPIERVVYRHVAKLDAAEGWVTAGVVMGWYGVDHDTVLAWVRRGVLDAAIERGSPVKRYRVLDPAACAREGAQVEPEFRPAPKTAKRGRKRAT